VSHEPAAPATLNGTESPLTQPAGGDNPRRDPPARRSSRRWLVAGLAAGALVVAGSAVSVVLLTDSEADRIGLSEALAVIAEGEVASAVLHDDDALVRLTLADATVVEASYPAAYSDELTQTLVDSGAAVRAEPGGRSLGSDIALRALPLLVILAVLFFVLRTVNPGGMMRAHRHRALAAGEIPTDTFEDVAGVDEAVDQLREMVQFLRDPARFEALGATRPRGALLVGPPGTGKTLLARAVAGEAEVPFFALAGSDFVETYVGTGARRVRDLFAQARKVERAIVFIDEIDAVGRTRSDGPTNGGEGERENTLVALLNEMDGFTGSQIIVLAATNRPDTLDPALIRPGRLDRRIEVPNPDRRGRTLILLVHAAGRPIGDVDLVQIARQTPGMSGADLAQVVNEACMEAARRERVTVDDECFQAAVATVAMGRARTSALVTDFDREVTAWHEAGHTLAAVLLPDADDPVSVTIVPRGPAGGATQMGGNDDVFLPRAKALARLTVSLAGRAAEERLLGGEHTQGATGDLQSATRLATAMVTEYGMTDFGFAQLDADTLRVGGQVAAQAHTHVAQLLADAHQRATDLLASNAGALEALATALLAEETLSGAAVRELVEHARGAAA
jgi:cell division protease FtsH